jgi:hypothetical protein
MSGSVDLRELLNEWPYDPEKDARLVRGDDGRELLQVRTPLGIEQYEVNGRPDGLRPHDKETAFEYYWERYEEAKKGGREEAFRLSARDCGELFNEGTLFYFRYVRLFQLKDWERTLRDTARNLRVFDFVHTYAKREEDRQFLEKWRPYILRVNSTAAAMLAIDDKLYDRALELVDEGLRKIESLTDFDDETFRFERERSSTGLRELRLQIQKNRPMSQIEQLEHQLRRAIQRQEFERAAELRDRIRTLRREQAC